MNALQAIRRATPLLLGERVKYVGTNKKLQDQVGEVIALDGREYGQVQVLVDFSGLHVDCYRLHLEKNP